MLFFSANYLRAQTFQELPLQDWSSAQGTQYMYYEAATVTDALSNVYVVGATINLLGNYDILVVKYNRYGVEQWTSEFDGAMGGDDFARAVGIDSNGDIYVTGAVENGNNEDYDLWLRKYSSSGSILWTNEYDGQAGSYDGGTCLTIDNNDNIYVAGGTATTSGGVDFLMAKYNSSGVQQWLNTWDNVGLIDGAVKIRYKNGSLSIAGGSQVSSIAWRFATVRVNAVSGAVITSTVSSGGNEGIDQITDLYVDDQDNSYIVGAVQTIGQGYDFKVMKLNSTLAVQWEDEFNGTSSLDDMAEAVKVDASGNVYVTGYSTDGIEGQNIITNKYNSSGTMVWSSEYNGKDNGADQGKGLVLNSSGDVYVVGTTLNGGSNDIQTLKYDASGNQVWEIAFNGVANKADEAMNITLDEEDAVIVVGQMEHFQSTRYVTIRYKEETVTFPPDEEDIPSSQYFTSNVRQLLDSDGDVEEDVLFYNTKDWPRVFICDDKVSYVTAKWDSLGQDSVHRVDMLFNKLNTDLRTFPVNKLEHYSNYYLGPIPEGRERVAHVNQLISPDVWNKVDILFSNNSNGLKYYLNCDSGFNPADLRWEYQGQSQLAIGQNGSLVIQTEYGTIIQPKGEAYEVLANGTRVDLAWQPTYSLNSNVVSLSLGSYNISNTLVLEFDQGESAGAPPLDGNLEWSSYIGSGPVDVFYDVKTDELENVVICGEVRSEEFPIETGTAQLEYGGDKDAIIFKLNHILEPQWGTYYGGGVAHNNLLADDIAYALDVEDEQIYITGITSSEDFPVEYGGVYEDDNSECGSPLCNDAWIMMLKDSGERIWATCYGDKDSDEQGWDIVVNGSSVYAVGDGDSTTPLENEMYTTGDGLIMKFSLVGEREMASLFPVFGIRGIQEDQNGNYFLTGTTGSGLPVVNNDANFQNSGTFGQGDHDSFLAKFSSSDVLQMAEFIGSNNEEYGIEVEIDSQGNVVVGGYQYGGEETGNYSIAQVQGTGWWQANQSSGNEEVWLMKTDNDGLVLWSTYYGAGPIDKLHALSVDNNDNIIFSGNTFGTGILAGQDLPSPSQNPANAWDQDGNNSGSWGRDEGWFCMMDSEGELVWTTYFGGDQHEQILGSTVSADDKYYIVGSTSTMNNALASGELPFPTEEFDDTFGTLDWFQDSEDETDLVTVYGFSARFNLGSGVFTTIENFQRESGEVFIFPNPSTGSLHVSYPEGTTKLEFYDIQGRLVYTDSQLEANLTKLDCSHWPNGVYLVHVTSNQTSISTKFIKL